MDCLTFNKIFDSYTLLILIRMGVRLYTEATFAEPYRWAEQLKTKSILQCQLAKMLYYTVIYCIYSVPVLQVSRY